jgi:hypothetical protein
MQPKLYLISIFLLLLAGRGRAQDKADAVDKAVDFPSSFFTKVNNKTTSLENQLTKQTEKYLQKLARKESRLKKKLAKVDSAAAANCFAVDPAQQYNALIQKLKTTTGKNTNELTGAYMPYIDSLKGSLSFLNSKTDLLKNSKVLPADVQKSLSQLQHLQGKMQQADLIKEFILQRKQNIKNYLSKYTNLPGSITNEYNDYSKQAYYYSQQAKEYKDVLNDPDKALKTALTTLNKLPAFNGFMKKNSMLASLFNLPGAATGAADPLQTVTGLQTRNQVTQAIQNQVGTSGPGANAMVQQNVQSAQGQVNALKEKLNSMGGGGGDLNMPDFKPNKQKTKSFLQRLEYGTNIQSTQSNYFFPTTTDLGFSIGYKLNDKTTVGIGASYKMGWGKDVRHISITQEGVGLRSFLDVKIKGSFYASGGFEYNYQQPFKGLIPPTRGLEQDGPTAWNQSGLIGVTKILSLKSNVVKKSKLQLLWDFLSYQQRPQTQAFKFRIGYNF